MRPEYGMITTGLSLAAIGASRLPETLGSYALFCGTVMAIMGWFEWSHTNRKNREQRKHERHLAAIHDHLIEIYGEEEYYEADYQVSPQAVVHRSGLARQGRADHFTDA